MIAKYNGIILFAEKLNRLNESLIHKDMWTNRDSNLRSGNLGKNIRVGVVVNFSYCRKLFYAIITAIGGLYIYMYRATAFSCKGNESFVYFCFTGCEVLLVFYDGKCCAIQCDIVSYLSAVEDLRDMLSNTWRYLSRSNCNNGKFPVESLCHTGIVVPWSSCPCTRENNWLLSLCCYTTCDIRSRAFVGRGEYLEERIRLYAW